MNCPKCGFNMVDLESLKKVDLQTLVGDELGLSKPLRRHDGSHFYHDFGFSGHKYRLVEMYWIIRKLKAKGKKNE